MINVKSNKNKDYKGVELAFFLIILCSIALQLVLGWGNSLSTLMRMIFVPGMVYVIGIYAKQYKHNSRFFFKRAFQYYILFMGFGLFREVVINKAFLVKSFARLFAFELVSRPANIFFTFMILYLVAIPLSRYMDKLLAKRWITVALCIISLGCAFIPENWFGNPLLGVFFGCDTYACIPLIPYTTVFVLGYNYEKLNQNVKRTTVFAFATSVLFALCSIIHSLQPLGKIMLGAFPAYVVYLLALNFKPYHAIRDMIYSLYAKMIQLYKYLKNLFSTNNKKASALYYVIYTITFFIMASIVFYAFAYNNATFVWISDAVGQYVPRAYYFINYVRDAVSEFFKGNFQLQHYDFSIGMGSNISFSHDPLYWIMAFFKASDVEKAYNFLTILRFYLTGLSASSFLLYYKKGYLSTWIASMAYTFCGFALYSGVLHTQFLAPMILLPCLIIATEEIYQKKRWYLCTVFVAISLLCSYYYMYMSTLAMGAYYLFRFIFETDKSKKNWKYFFTTTLTFAGSYLLGVTIGNITLVTAFASFLGSGRSSSKSFAAMSPFFYNNHHLSRLLMYFTTAPDNPGNALRLGFIPLSYISTCVLFIKRKDKELKALFITCLVCSIFPIAAYVLSGFSSITNRWVYIFSLVVTFITAHEFPKLFTLSKRELKIIFAFGIPYVILGICTEGYIEISVLASMALLFVNYAVILCMNHNIQIISKKTGKILLLLTCCLSIYIHGYGQYVIYQKNNTATEFVKNGEVYEYTTNTPTEALRDIEDDSFYRVSTAYVGLNKSSTALMQDLNTLAMYSSTLNGNIVNYNIENGNTSSSFALIQSGNFTARAFLDATACTKYYAVEDEDIELLPYGYEKIGEKDIPRKHCNLYKNKYALPMGFTYDKVISETDLYKTDTVDRQELMLQAAVVSDESNLTDTDISSLERTAQKVEITDVSCSSGVEIIDNKINVTDPDIDPDTESSVTLTFNGLENSETYLVFNGELDPSTTNASESCKLNVSSGNANYDYRAFSKNYNYCAGQETFIFNMGYSQDSKNTITVTFLEPGIFTFESVDIYCQPMDNYESYINNLSTDVLTDIIENGEDISGNIELSKEKFLMLSIPYQKGWTAYVDGKETKLEKTNLMYMGLPLKAGKHSIRLHYEQPGRKVSFMLTGIGIILFLFALMVRRWRIKTGRNAYYK